MNGYYNIRQYIIDIYLICIAPGDELDNVKVKITAQSCSIDSMVISPYHKFQNVPPQ